MRGLPDELTATRRDVRRRVDDGTGLVVVALQCRYEAPVEDVWDAVTDPDRLARWLGPVTGDLQEGGSLPLEGNAGWDVTVLAPALFLRGEVVEDPVAWEDTLEVQRVSERSIAAWADVVTAGRTATDDEVAAAVDAARAQFAPDLPTAPATADD